VIRDADDRIILTTEQGPNLYHQVDYAIAPHAVRGRCSCPEAQCHGGAGEMLYHNITDHDNPGNRWLRDLVSAESLLGAE
jgi:hypothetical protein